MDVLASPAASVSRLPAIDKPVVTTAPAPAKGHKIPFIFGIRGLTSLYIVVFHLNYMLLEEPHHALPALYTRLTSWLQVGDFRIAAFFVISGYLLAMPAARTAHWVLKDGVRGFLTRRTQRLVLPYYIAVAFSIPLYVAWRALSGDSVAPSHLAIGVLAHVLMIDNWNSVTMLGLNAPLWNVALEFQCYILFATVLLWLTRRIGPLTQFGIVLVASLVPHFLFHGAFDYVRLWFVALYALGVAAIGISNPSYPQLKALERAVPWGFVWVGASIAALIAIVAGGKDVSYGDGWLQNLLTGFAVAAFLIHVRTGLLGPTKAFAQRVVRILEWTPLRRLGSFSYSTYLIHAPILQLCTWSFARLTGNIWLQAAAAYGLFVPLTFALAYAFHVRFERPFQQPAAVKAAA
jgi:peptidoglycan/LPS O-acetylase OafA/YrhL